MSLYALSKLSIARLAAKEVQQKNKELNKMERELAAKEKQDIKDAKYKNIKRNTMTR